jgi:hypothetical protein
MYSRGLLPAGALERLSDVVYRTMLNDTLAAGGTRPEDTWGRLLTPARPTHPPSIAARAPHFAKWQERTGRTFPVVVLAVGSPMAGDEARA